MFSVIYKEPDASELLKVKFLVQITRIFDCIILCFLKAHKEK